MSGPYWVGVHAVLSYQKPGLTLAQGKSNDKQLVRDLQRHLRALGYLRQGIDGDFGDGTRIAVRSLQYDLLHNRGKSGQGDGEAAVAIADYNAAPGGGQCISSVTGILDENLATCIDRMLGDANLSKVPSDPDPKAANARAVEAIRGIRSTESPSPFIAAMVVQESGGQHFRVPSGKDGDNFVVVGLDRNSADKDQITSRGYGIGQYTIFHHPPRSEEVTDFILDPVRNIEKAFRELREKFDGFVKKADDRKAEHNNVPLRLCKYPQADPLYMRDCAACAAATGKLTVRVGTPHYAGSGSKYEVSQYYKSADYDNVPNRADFKCDWPYAARRYNGGGNNSYHYQTRILRNLLKEPKPV